MPDQILIRPAKPADRSAVTQLLRQSYPQLLAPDYSAQTPRDVLPHITTAQSALLDCGTYYLAQAKTGQVVGAGGWTDVSPARRVSSVGEGNIRHVATHPGHLRKGIAQQLIAASLASARNFGVERMNCMSTLTARTFYEAMQFRVLNEVELTLSPGVHFPAFQMVRDL